MPKLVSERIKKLREEIAEISEPKYEVASSVLSCGTGYTLRKGVMLYRRRITKSGATTSHATAAPTRAAMLWLR